MLAELYTPYDNQRLTEKYLGEGKGICGISCLAIIEKRTIKNVLRDFDFKYKFKGYTTVKQLRTYLENKEYKVKFVNRDGYHDFSKLNYIVRIQWLGDGKKQEQPFYGWGHWTEATNQTHFIMIMNNKFFCNENNKWQSLPRLHKYLAEGNGIVTSYLEVNDG